MGPPRFLGLLLALAGLAVSLHAFVGPGPPALEAKALAAHGRRRGAVMMVKASRASGRQQEPQHTRKDVVLGLMSAVVGASALGGAPATSNAWCGKPYPSWAYRIPFNDGNFKARVTGIDKLADVFLRVVGKEPKAGNPPPILLIPTIGMAHDYLETLEALTYGDRQVILFDPVGVGQSSRRLPVGLLPEADATEEEALRGWSGMVVETCRAVVEFLELNGTDIHLLGHGAGAIPALEYAAELAAAPSSTVGAVKSVTLADPFVLGGRGALSKPYSAAAQPVPLCVSESVEGFGPVAAVLKAEETRGGTGAGIFFDGAIASPAFDKLNGIPTFISYGSKNEEAGLDDRAAQRIAARVPAGTEVAVKRFDSTALAHVDYAEGYADWVDENLQRAEGKMRPV